jgi:uncharacterized DUF497 family protein
MAKIEWDENKRLSNIAKHGFDFLDVEEVLYGIHVVIASRYSGKEQRWLSTGKIHGRFATVVFTMRGDDYRIITIRSARNDERGKYQELYS